MSTNKEDGLEFTGSSKESIQLFCLGPQSLLRLQELLGDGVVFRSFDRGRVEWCRTSSWRSDCDLGMRSEDFIWMGKFGLDDVRRFW